MTGPRTGKRPGHLAGRKASSAPTDLVGVVRKWLISVGATLGK